MDLGLRGRVYVITGGSRGLGRATAEALVADGARVVVNSRDEAAVARAAEELGGAESALGVAGDLATPGTAERLVAAAQARYGRLDGALLSVGGPPPGSALETEDVDWLESFESVFLGPVRVARAVARALLERRDSDSASAGDGDGAAIALVLSTSARSPIPGLAVSNGLRPGLAMLAKTLADELGPRGVRVLGLLPGSIATDRLRELDTASGRPEELRRARESGIPLRRYGRPEEFGRTAAFLLSPAASYLTGVMVPVDGGALRTL